MVTMVVLPVYLITIVLRTICVVLYRGEIWALTRKLKIILFSYDRKMLRYMAGVTGEMV